MNFGEHVALLREFQSRRQPITDQIESRLLDSRGKADDDLEPMLEASRQLAAAHLADGFEPTALDGSSHQLDPIGLAARARQACGSGTREATARRIGFRSSKSFSIA